LRGGETAERFFVGFAAVRVERGEPAPVKVLQVGVGARQRQIDIVEHVRVARARLARCAGHEPFGKCRNGGGVFAVEECAEPRAARRRMGGAGSGSRRACVMRLRERVGHKGCASDGTCADRRAEQECAARFIMLGHGLSPPVVRS
jgi:hypothetical protein